MWWGQTVTRLMFECAGIHNNPRTNCSVAPCRYLSSRFTCDNSDLSLTNSLFSRLIRWSATEPTALRFNSLIAFNSLSCFDLLPAFGRNPLARVNSLVATNQCGPSTMSSTDQENEGGPRAGKGAADSHAMWADAMLCST